jgi:ribosomal protein L27
VYAADTVGNGNNRTLIANFSGVVKAFDAALNQLTDF